MPYRDCQATPYRHEKTTMTIAITVTRAIDDTTITTTQVFTGTRMARADLADCHG